jgi:hypothetical protein
VQAHPVTACTAVGSYRNQTDLSVGCEPASIVRLTEKHLADIAMDPVTPLDRCSSRTD